MFHSSLLNINNKFCLQDEEQPLSLSEIKLELGAVERGWAKKELHGWTSSKPRIWNHKLFWTILGFWDKIWDKKGGEGPVSDIKAMILIHRMTVKHIWCISKRLGRCWDLGNSCDMFYLTKVWVLCVNKLVCVMRLSCLPVPVQQQLFKPAGQNISRTGWDSCDAYPPGHSSLNLMIANLSCDPLPANMLFFSQCEIFTDKCKD